MTKSILILISVGIFVSLITSGVCSGPIDQIFNGWRDTTACEMGIWSCFVGEPATNHQRDGGVAVLFILSFFILIIFGIYKAFSSLRRH